LLTVRDTGTCACEPAAQLLRRRLAELDAEMAHLAAQRTELVAMVEALPAGTVPTPSRAPGAHPRRGGERHARDRDVVLLRGPGLPARAQNRK
jgi:hypothetical protein